MSRSGILVLDKPVGVTSRKVVDAVVRLVRPAKAGHAGTLDPLASGVLVVCVGRATRLVEYVQRMPKSYRGAFLLGRTSPTEDVEGEVQELLDPPKPTIGQLRDACRRLTGRIMQRPPGFSALKVAGRRAYELARSGKTVDLKPREVTIHKLTIDRYDYPELELSVVCGSGTYIRSLGRDLAESVGTAAVMSALRRTAIGAFSIDRACPLEQLSQDTLPERLLPARLAVALPTLQLTAEEATLVSHGVRIRRENVENESEWAALGPDGELAAVLQPTADGELRVVRNVTPVK